MTPQLFRRVKQRPGPIMDHETTLDFLTRGGRSEGVAIREWMEKWFQRYPVDHREELKNRFQSQDFGQFMGAYFELQVFAMLRLLDCDVDIHPSFTGTGGTVDFRVTHGEDSFYVEATVCGLGQGILSSSANEEDAVRKIREAIGRPHSDVWLEAEGELLKTLRKNRLVGPVQELLASCSADDVCGLEAGHSWRRPRTSITEGDWRLDVLLARPIASDGQGQVRGPSRGGCVDGSSPVSEALSKKVKDWKKKGLENEAFVIAINNCHSEYWWGDERSAIYTTAAPLAGQDAFSSPLRCVSGVVVFGQATLGNERGAPVRLYENPDRDAPDCLRFLRQETSLGGLIGLS